MTNYSEVRSSSSSKGSYCEVNYGDRSYRPPVCHCRRFTVVYTSNTSKNPKKQFYGCPYFKEGNRYCVKFFMWVEDWERIQGMKEEKRMDHSIDIENLEANVKEIDIIMKEHVV